MGGGRASGRDGDASPVPPEAVDDSAEHIDPAGWTRQSGDVTVLSSTELELLGDAGQGSAEIVDHDGSLQLRLATTGIEPTDGFTEVWLINPDVTELISLGPIRTDGVYDLPTGLDPAAFPIVDISSERYDGNPQHSGDSILRGQFAF